MKRRHRYLAVLAVAVLVAVLSASAARSSPVERWPRLACASGAITSLELWQATTSTLPAVEVAGRVDCAGSGYFGLASYRPDSAQGFLSDGNMIPYAPDGTVTTFALARSLATASESVGVCLVTDYEVRLSCFAVHPTGQLPVMRMEQSIPVSDPLVTKRITVLDPNRVPLCGTCL